MSFSFVNIGLFKLGLLQCHLHCSCCLASFSFQNPLLECFTYISFPISYMPPWFSSQVYSNCLLFVEVSQYPYQPVCMVLSSSGPTTCLLPHMRLCSSTVHKRFLFYYKHLLYMYVWHWFSLCMNNLIPYVSLMYSFVPFPSSALCRLMSHGCRGVAVLNLLILVHMICLYEAKFIMTYFLTSTAKNSFIMYQVIWSMIRGLNWWAWYSCFSRFAS